MRGKINDIQVFHAREIPLLLSPANYLMCLVPSENVWRLSLYHFPLTCIKRKQVKTTKQNMFVWCWLLLSREITPRTDFHFIFPFKDALGFQSQSHPHVGQYITHKILHICICYSSYSYSDAFMRRALSNHESQCKLLHTGPTMETG